MNDDLVQPVRGFPNHGSKDAEICTYVVEGHLTHRDKMGNNETLASGAVKCVTAGQGITHSEYNDDVVNPLRCIQVWLAPRKLGLKPNYGSSPGNEAARKKKWHHIVSDINNQKAQTDITINSDANVFVAEIEEGNLVQLEVIDGRQAYLLCIDGRTSIFDQHDGRVCPRTGVRLQCHDAAEIVGPEMMKMAGPSHLLVVEMAHNPKSNGRRDLD